MTTNLLSVIEQLVEALDDATTSLETISRLAGKTHYVGNGGERVETYMEHHDQVRGYAISRASAARAALSRAQAAPAVGVPDGYVLVPKELTPEMEAAYVDKAEEQDPFRTHWLNRHGYRAMIAAAARSQPPRNPW